MPDSSTHYIQFKLSSQVYFSILVFLSLLAHIILIALVQLGEIKEISMPQVGLKDGKKSSLVFIKSASQKTGNKQVLAVKNQSPQNMPTTDHPEPVLNPEPNLNPNPQLSLHDLANPNNNNNNNLSQKKSVSIDSINSLNAISSSDTKAFAKINNPTPGKKNAHILLKEYQGDQVINSQQTALSSQSRYAISSSMFGFAIVVPKGVPEDQLNHLEEVFFSFRKRIVEQYINKILVHIEPTSQKSKSSFPWTNKAQKLQYKLVFDESGELIRIEKLQQSDSKILNYYYDEVMYDMNTIPNPPKAIINDQHQFELIFGLNIEE